MALSQHLSEATYGSIEYNASGDKLSLSQTVLDLNMETRIRPRRGSTTIIW